METIIAAVILLAVIGAAVFYLVRASRKGVKCVGCPYAKQCGSCCGKKPKRKEKKHCSA